MNITLLRELVADYVNRDLDTLASGTTDKVVLAINHAKKYAQREHSFELCRLTVDLVVTKANGGDLSTAVEHGTSGEDAVPVSIKTIERAFVATQTAGVYVPIDYVSRNTQIKSMQRQTANPREWRGKRGPETCAPNSTPQLVRQGNIVLLHPWDTTAYGETSVGVSLDVVKWLPEYALIPDGYGQPEGTVASDFLMEHCNDWLLLRSIIELNFFLKEDQRVAISAATLGDLWSSIVKWDNELTSSHIDDNNLD